MRNETILIALIVAGLSNGVVIGTIMLLGNRKRRASLALGSLMILAAMAGALILFYGDVPPAKAGLVLALELALTLVAGPLFLVGIAWLLGCEIARWQILVSIAAAILFVSVISLSSHLDPVIPAVITQMAFTASGAWLYSQHYDVGDQRTRRFQRRRMALAVLLTMSALHTVQLAKILLPRSDAMAWAVPSVLAMIMALAATALIASAARRIEMGPATDHAPVQANRAPVDALIRLKLSNPDLDGELIATTTNLSLSDLRALYADKGGVSAAIRQMRVNEAASQLSDAGESGVSIDAISLGCGFRSRSAFYRAFRRVHGCSPGEYRKQNLTCPDLLNRTDQN